MYLYIHCYCKEKGEKLVFHKLILIRHSLLWRQGKDSTMHTSCKLSLRANGTYSIPAWKWLGARYGPLLTWLLPWRVCSFLRYISSLRNHRPRERTPPCGPCPHLHNVSEYGEKHDFTFAGQEGEVASDIRHRILDHSCIWIPHPQLQKKIQKLSALEKLNRGDF